MLRRLVPVLALLLVLVACGGDDGGGDGGEDAGGGGLRGCIEDTGFRIVDDDEPRFGAETELQLDTGVDGAPGFIGVFVYASPEAAATGEEALREADASTTEVVGTVVLTGSQQEGGEAFATAAAEIRDCAAKA